jgi:hypothetical protein
MCNIVIMGKETKKLLVICMDCGLFLESRFDQIVLACKNFLSLVEKESVWLQCLMYHSCGLGHYCRPKMGDKHS